MMIESYQIRNFSSNSLSMFANHTFNKIFPFGYISFVISFWFISLIAFKKNRIKEMIPFIILGKCIIEFLFLIILDKNTYLLFLSYIIFIILRAIYLSKYIDRFHLMSIL